MKPKPLLLLFILIAQYTFSQSLESLKVATNKIYEANYLMDFETIASLTYPKIYEEQGKDAFIELQDLQFQNAEYRVRLQLPKVPFQYGTIKKIRGKSFCVITCRNPMRYFFETKLTAETAAEKKAWLQEFNTTKEVTFEPNRNSFNVKKTSTFVAVMDENTNNEWRFFNFDDTNQLDTFQLLFNASVKKELGL